MKYGETLAQRSPPEWEAYNVDYNDIKSLIKEHTTRPGSAAITIPGAQPVGEAFESELYDELANQHQRIDLFVRSKAGEIQRRLNHLEKITLQLQHHPQVAGRTKISVKRLEKFSRLENEVMRAGDQIQTLARYIGAQAMAFKKLLKKYRKWTGSTQLDARFEKGVTYRNRSFEKQNLDPLLLHYTELLTAVRAPFEAGVTWNVSEEDSRAAQLQHKVVPANSGQQTASDLQRIFEGGTDLEADAALAALPFGPKAGHTSYWVHSENLLQLHVLLLRYTRLKVGNSVASASREPSRHSLRRDSTDGPANLRFTSQETNGIIVCDDLESFAKGRSGVTIDQLEAGAGKRAEAAAMSIRYAPSGECLVLAYLDDSLANQDGKTCVSMPTKFKSKTLRPLFDSGKIAVEDMNRSDAQDLVSFLQKDPMRVQKWLQEHRSVQPLVHLRYKRSRFVGLANSHAHGLWVALDDEVQMRRASLADFDSDAELDEFEDFPHAVLEVRWEGRDVPEIVHILNQSHLVERIPGFSLEIQAVASLCHSPEMPRPHWMSTLRRDIRKIPQNAHSTRHRNSLIASEAASDLRPSTGTNSTVGNLSSGAGSKTAAESPATSVPEKPDVPPLHNAGKKRQLRRPARGASGVRHNSSKRYWNEFDDGEDAAESAAYTVLVDPNTSTPFVDGWESMKAQGSQALRKLLALFATNKTRSGEGEALLSRDYFSLPRAEEGVEHSTPESEASTPPSTHRPSLPSRYSVFPTYHSISSPLDPLSSHTAVQRDQRLGRFAVVAFLTSLVLVLAVGAVQLSWRNGASTAADITVVFGIVASVICAVTGVGLMVARDDDAGWMGAAQVGLVFAVLCVGNGVLIVHLAAG